MLDYEITGSFKRDRKLLEKRSKDMRKLRDVMAMLINEQPLPPERRNHPLHGEWNGSLECHIQGDWVLVYEIDSNARKVTFQRTGTHSDLF
jgi:mRNA interferase YafQ